MPQRHGGLGIIDLQHRNASLLAKWNWRYHIEKNALWRELLPLNLALLTLISSRAQNLSIHLKVLGPLKLPRALFTHTSSTNSAMDVLYLFGMTWMGSQPLQQLFPSLYQLCTIKNAPVSDFWNHTSASWA